MTEIWIDAQLSPALAAWINRTYDEMTAKSVRAMGLRDAEDAEIFRAARKAAASDILRQLGYNLTTLKTSLEEVPDERPEGTDPDRIPLTSQASRTIAQMMEEARSLGSGANTEHLLLGLLAGRWGRLDPPSAVLDLLSAQCGVTYGKVRETVEERRCFALLRYSTVLQATVRQGVQRLNFTVVRPGSRSLKELNSEKSRLTCPQSIKEKPIHLCKTPPNLPGPPVSFPIIRPGQN